MSIPFIIANAQVVANQNAGGKAGSRGLDRFQLYNVDTNENHVGQFFSLNTRAGGGSAWAQHTALNRQNPISQFLHGQAETVNFEARYYQRDSNDDSPRLLSEQLRAWCRRDNRLRRPPILQFSLGDGHLAMTCFMEACSVSYAPPTQDGSLRDVTVSVSLKQYEPFDFNATTSLHTRYHHARERDYHEMLAWREYGNPLLGDVVRKQNPDKADLQPGDVVPLPAVEAVRDSIVQPTSIPLQTSFGRKDTPQRQLRQDIFARRAGPATSHVQVR